MGLAGRVLGIRWAVLGMDHKLAKTGSGFAWVDPVAYNFDGKLDWQVSRCLEDSGWLACSYPLVVEAVVIAVVLAAPEAHLEHLLVRVRVHIQVLVATYTHQEIREEVALEPNEAGILEVLARFAAADFAAVDLVSDPVDASAVVEAQVGFGFLSGRPAVADVAGLRVHWEGVSPWVVEHRDKDRSMAHSTDTLLEVRKEQSL